MSSSRAVRAAHLPSAQTPISTVLAHQRLLNSQIASRRSLTTNVARSPRPMVCSRPGLRPVQLPKQRRNCRHHSGSSSNTSKTQKEGGSLSQRLRRLSREYGWSALGVYFALSALDFPFCFAAVRLLGVDRIGHLEHVVVQAFKNAMHTVWPQGESEIPDQAEVEGVVTDKQGRLAQAESQDQEEASMMFPLFFFEFVRSHIVFQVSGPNLHWPTRFIRV